jgi:transposase InsO family protein
MEPSRIPLAMKLRSMELLEQGASISAVARLFGWSRQTLSKWWGRYQAQGVRGLTDQTTRPHRSPQCLSESVVQQILVLRRRERWGPLRIALHLGVGRSSVSRTLCRHGLQYLLPPAPRLIQRYEKTAPGELLQLDVKILVPPRRRLPPEHQFAVLDGFSREAFRRIYPTATTRAATDFLLSALQYYRYPVQAALTDNALCFTMRHPYHAERVPLFAKTCAELGIRQALIRPYRPQTNGKVERFFRTVQEECYERLRFRDSSHRALSLDHFVRYYNHDRPHLSLGGLTPRPEQYFQLSTMS